MLKVRDRHPFLWTTISQAESEDSDVSSDFPKNVFIFYICCSLFFLDVVVFWCLFYVFIFIFFIIVWPLEMLCVQLTRHHHFSLRLFATEQNASRTHGVFKKESISRTPFHILSTHLPILQFSGLFCLFLHLFSHYLEDSAFTCPTWN